ILAKERSQKETINDLHGDIINLARVVSIEPAAVQLYERLNALVFCESILRDARAFMDAHGIPESPGPGECSDEMLERAYWFFLESWMGRNGTAGAPQLRQQIAVRWTNSGGFPTVRFKNAVRSIPAWHDRLLNVVILTRD